MKFSDVFNFLKPVASIAASFIPGGSTALELINAVLPDGEKLPPTASEKDVVDAYNNLPPEIQLSLKEQEVKLEIAKEVGWTERFGAMVKADGQSTRPKIAVMMAQVLCFEICAFTVWCFVYPEQMKNPILWTVFASLTATPAGLLAKYFGELRKEQTNRISGANTQPLSIGMVDNLTKIFKK